MKLWKRLLSLVLAVCLVSSMGIVLPEVKADSSSTPTATTWDCSSENGWTLANGFALEDGKLVWRAGLNTTAGAHGTAYGQYAGNKTIVSDSAATGWTNYSVSVDITSTYNGSTHAVNGTTLNQFAYGGINFYVSDTDWVQVRVQPGNTLNKYGLTVYENSTTSALTSGTVTVGTDGSVEKTFRAYNVKAELTADGKLVIYINGEKVKELTVSLPAGGAPALMAWPSSTSATTQDTVTFDNVQIKPLAEPSVAPTPDYSGTLLGWSDGTENLSSDWTVSGSYTAENGVLKATTADNFFAKVSSAVQHGYIEADITMPAKSDFTATANKSFGYVNATIGTNQVYTLRLFWQQKSQSTTLHDGTLYADLFINDSPLGTSVEESNHHYGGAAQGTRISYTLADANWGKTYTLRLARIGNLVEAKLIDKETSEVLKTWQYALNPAYSIVTGAMTLGFGADVKDSGCNVAIDNVVAAQINANAVSVGELDLQIDALEEITKGLDDAAQKMDSFYRTAYAPGETVTVKLTSADAWDLNSLKFTTASNPAGSNLVATADDTVYTFVMPGEAVTLVGQEKKLTFADQSWNFDTYPADWNTHAAYAVENGKLVWHSKSESAAQTQYSGGMVYAVNAENAALWTSYTASVDVKVNKSSNNLNGGYPMAALTVAHTEVGRIQLRVRPSTVANKYYIAVYETVGATNTALYNPSAAVEVDGDAVIAADDSVEFTISATVIDGVVTMYIDGDEVFATTSNLSNKAGSVGVAGFATSGTSAVVETVEFDNITVTFPKKPLDYNATLVDRNDGSATLDADLWTKTGDPAFTANGGVLVANGAVNYKTKQNYTNGYIEADITLTEGAMADMTANGDKYGGNLSARWISSPNHEVRSRFKINKNVSTGAYKATLQLVIYSSPDFGGTPQLHNYEINDFAWGKTYNVRLVVLGNFFKVQLDGEDVIAICATADSDIGSYAGGGFGLAHVANSFDIAVDNLVVASVEPQAVRFDSNIGNKATLPAAIMVGASATKVQRTQFAPGETVTVTFNSTDMLDMATLRYTTATNPDGLALTATADENVYTFVMPEEAVTVVCSKVAGPANEDLYVNDGTADLVADAWGALITKSDKGLSLVTDMATKNANKTLFYSTAMNDGWIKADITLPTITAAQMVANNGASGNVSTGDTANLFYGFMMQDASTADNKIEAAIFYQRNAGSGESAAYTKFRVRCTGAGYNAINIAQIDVPNSIWDSSKPVTIMLRKVGNYVEAILIADGVTYTAAGTAAATTILGSNTTNWKFGLYTNVGMLFTDTSKSAKVDRTAYYTNIEIGRINKLTAVSVDAESAASVSLPVVNQIGTTTALERTGYQVGEVLKLTVAAGANAANLKYATAINTDGVAIADANAFQIPNEDAITVVYQEAPVVPEPGDTLHSATYTGGALDADLWTAGGTVTANANGISGSTAMSVRYPEKFANGYMEAEFAITGDISNNALIFVRSPKNNTATGQNHEIVLRWTVSGTTATPQIVLRDYTGLGGYELASSNAIHGKPNKVTLTPDPVTGVMTLKVKVEVLGNLIRVYTNDTLNMEATLNPAFAVGYQEGYFGAALTADADVTITKMTVQEVKTYSVTGTDALVTDEITHMVEPQLRQPSFSRTQYAAGELVSVTVKNAEGLDLSTLRYTTATNAEGVSLTATAVPNVFTFVMPEENVTLVCDEKTVIAPSTVVATTDGTALDTNIWAVTGNPAVANGVITSTGTNTVLTKVAYQHASITAEITLPATHSLTANATVAAVVARINANQEHVARFQWANSAGNLQIGMLVRDEVNTSNTTTNPHYGGGAHGISRGNNHNEAWGKTYIVEVIRIGNLVSVTFTDKATDAVVESWTYNLNPAYEVTTTPMYFGFTTGMAGVVIDNVVVTSYDVHTVSAGELDVTIDKAAEIANGLDSSGLQHFDRTHYAAGETVTVMVSNTTGLDLTTLRYTTATNTAGTVLTATAVPGVYTFVMPQEDVTLVCDALIVTEPSEVIATVDGEGNLDADLWTVTGAYTADGTIRTTANNFKAVLDGTYQQFAIESEITVPAKPADLSANITFATMVATAGTNQAYTVRFFWQGGSNQTFYFDLFVDDSVNGTTYGSGKNNYGGAANGGRIGTPLTDSHWDKTYVVTMSRIGNYLFVKAMDKETSAVVAELAYNLNPDYTIVKKPVTLSFSADGSKGEVAFDNLKVTSYNTVSVSKGELDVSLDARNEHAKGLEVDAKMDTFDRTAYVAGETVTVKVNDPSQLDLSTIRYVSASHLEGVLLTATGDPTVFTFVMPNENVTLVCDEGTGIPVVPRPEGEVFKEDFDSFADGTAAGTALNGLTVKGNAAIKNGALEIPGEFSAVSTSKHQHGYIQADITLAKPLADLENATAAVTKYGANLDMKWNNNQGTTYEVRTRFMIKRDPNAVQEYTVQLQLILYSTPEYGGGVPVTHAYDISSSFAWGNTYNVKLEVIGNMIRVYLDGAVVMTYAVAGDGELAAYAGYFGVVHTANSFSIAVDNVDMHEYKAYRVAFDANMEGILNTDAYIIYQSGKLAIRTHFLENEFVRLNVNAPAGFGIDDATIKYTGTECGEVAITAKESAVLYGFRMPAEDVVVSAGLTVAEIDTKPIADNFDVESLMQDRGWSNEKKILDGSARLFGSTDSYLVGVAGSDTWVSYTASAKITFLGNTSTGTGAAALCAKTASTAGGYEFGIEMSAGSKVGRIRLYDRSTSTMLYVDATSTIEIGKTYELTMVVFGNRITCYVNGAWRCSVTVNEAVGGIGIRTLVANASFDDIQVTNIVTK